MKSRAETLPPTGYSHVIPQQARIHMSPRAAKSHVIPAQAGIHGGGNGPLPQGGTGVTGLDGTEQGSLMPKT